MPIARFQLPDGRVARFEVPEGTTPEQAQAQIEAHLATVPKASAPAPSQPDETERIAGSPAVRYAMGAAAPFLGAAQLGAEAVGYKGVTEHLKRLDEMKRRGMTPAAELENLKQARDQLSKLKGYEGAIARIDQQIAAIGDAPSADPQDAGFDVAGLAGTVMSPAVLAAMKLKAAPTVLGRSGQGAAIGAAFGAASPVTQGDDFWAPKAAQIATGVAIGGALPPAIEASHKVLRVGRNMLDPLLPGGADRGAARILAEAAGPKRAAIEAELAKNQMLVPGSQPTAAEAAARAGSPEFSAMQQIAREHKPSAYSDIGKAQEGARAASIQSFGKDKAILEAEEGIRSAVANRMYGKAFEQSVRADPKLAQLARNPFFKDALPHAVKLAEAKGLSAKANLTEFLHFVKLGLDKELSKTGDTALSATEKGAVQQLKKELVKWMGAKNTDYDKARTLFAKFSKPINEMQVGQQLESALAKPIGEGERAGVFAGAMQNAPATIKKATGQRVAEELEEVLQPENLGKVKGVLADLARKAEFDRLAPLGRSRAAQIAQPFGLPATGPLHQSYMIFKTILGRVSKGINEKTLDNMAEALELPSSALRLLQRAPTDKQAQVIDQIIAMKLGRGAIAAATELSGEGIQQ